MDQVKVCLDYESLAQQKIPFMDDLMRDNMGLCCGIATIPENCRKEFLYEHYGDFRVYRLT